jgi:hypothetical protein
MRRTSALALHHGSDEAGVIGWECPDCHSTDLVKLSLVYATGTAALTGVARGRSLFVGENGLAIGFGSFKTSGMLQTQLARIASPPRKKRYRYVVAGWILGLYQACLVAASMQSGGSIHVLLMNYRFALFIGIYSLVFTVVLGVFWHHNHAIYSERHTDWARSFMCRRCGTIVRVGPHD